MMFPQGHPHQPGPILYPILTWHFPMVLNAMAKKCIHLKWLICPHNNRSLSCYLLSWNPYIDYLSFGYLGFPPQIKIIYGPHLLENLNHIQNVLPLVDVLSCRQSTASRSRFVILHLPSMIFLLYGHYPLDNHNNQSPGLQLLMIMTVHSSKNY